MYFSTHFWTNYIDRVSPRAHDRIGRTRALATCVMADLRTLYRMCSKADKWTHLTVCAWVRNNIIPSVLAAAAGVPRGWRASCRLCGQRGCDRTEAFFAARAMWHTRSRRVGQCCSVYPSGCAGPMLPLAGHQGMARGFLQGKS